MTEPVLKIIQNRFGNNKIFFIFVYWILTLKNKKMDMQFKKEFKQIWSETSLVGKVIIVIISVVTISCGVMGFINGVNSF